MRGNLETVSALTSVTGSIPARAGEPPVCTVCSRRREVYPRPCGGNLDKAGVISGLVRSIPARAGEPESSAAMVDFAMVYPRPCGGTAKCSRFTSHPQGLSPPVRGNPKLSRLYSLISGSIPARAGEPEHRPSRPSPSWVYPRPCGGTAVTDWRAVVASGLSPPVRGNHFGVSRKALYPRSIPARAGGTPMVFVRLALVKGLSPPVRGNREPAVSGHTGSGSIPARAGEPTKPTLLAHSAEVYPRPCGGTQSPAKQHSDTQGLSPPVRGNLLCHIHLFTSIGSIPARAGEPRSSACLVRQSEVYPRPCGGTAATW